MKFAGMPISNDSVSCVFFVFFFWGGGGGGLRGVFLQVYYPKLMVAPFSFKPYF